MSNMQSNVRTTVIGTVTAVYQPGWKVSNAGNEYLAGGKLVLDSKEGVCEVSFLQLYVDNKKTEDMPQIWKDIDADWIKGKRVAVACVFASDYPNPTTGVVKHQYKNPTDIQYLDEDPPTQGESEQDSEDAPPPPTAPSQPNQPKPYAPESRMEIGMATGNAKNGGYTVISAYYEKHGELPNDEFLTAFAERVNFFADALMNPPEEEVVLAVEADEPDEFESLGSI